MRAMKWIGLIVLILCTGCAGVGKYARDRGNDFLDCFTAQGGLGLGLPAVELHATDWLTTGAGCSLGVRWGLQGGDPGLWSVTQFGVPLLPLLTPLVYRKPPPADLLRDGDVSRTRPPDDLLWDGDVRWLYTYVSRTYQGLPFFNTHGLRVSKSVLLFDVTCIPKFAYHYDAHGGILSGWSYELVHEKRKLVEALDVHVDATAALLLGPSVRLGFSPGQFADFVLGFFGLDIAGDDAKPQPLKTKEGGKR